MHTDATPIYGGVYGSGSGPIYITCPQYFLHFTPIGNCSTSIPDQSTCTHEHDVGVHCSPGLCKL